jgi:hypothetical protein
MWALLSARLRLWLLRAVGVPILGWLLGALGDRIEARHGPTTTSRALKNGRDWLRRRARDPLAGDHRDRR